MNGWLSVPLLDAIKDVTGGNVKTPQAEYEREGSLPIVDQGSGLVGGYTSNGLAAFVGQLPVIVFGDHTRGVKYVDFSFGMGADGVKVLSPRDGWHPKFVYHYLLHLQLPNAGYSRHYKFLKQCSIPNPPIEEQVRIAAVLDRADALRAKRREALAYLAELSQSIFLEMFGDPTRNPRGWACRTFAELCSRVTVGVVVQPASYYVEAGVPALRSLNVKPGYLRMEPLVYFSHEDNDGRLAKSRLRAGDLAIVRSGQPGTAAVIPAELDGINAIDLIIATPDRAVCEPVFLASFMNSTHGKAMVVGSQRGQIQQHLNVGSLNEAQVLTPPLDVQREFVARVAVVEELKTASHLDANFLRDLFISLQDRAFRGDL